VIPRIMSPTAASVTEAPAGREAAALVDSVAAGLAELVAAAVGDAAVLPGEWPEHAETASATAGPRIARSLLRRMRPNLAPDGPACGDVAPAGGSGRYMVTSVDRQALRRKYAEERDKRLRPDGNDQYLRISDEFAHYLAEAARNRRDRLVRRPLVPHQPVGLRLHRR
jgi:hypothetical protein